MVISRVIFFIGILSLAASGIVQAQFGIGVNAGLFYTNVRGELNSISTGKIGISYGAMILKPLDKEHWYLAPEMIAEHHGFEVDHYVRNEFDELEQKTSGQKLNYLRLPFMFQYHLSGEKPWYVALGPYGGYMYSAEFEYYDGESEYNRSSVETLAYGFCAGIGYLTKNKKGLDVQIEGRYTHGLSPAIRTIDDSSLSDFKIRVGLIYQIPEKHLVPVE